MRLSKQRRRSATYRTVIACGNGWKNQPEMKRRQSALYGPFSLLSGQAAAVRPRRLTLSSDADDELAASVSRGRKPSDPSSSANATQFASRADVSSEHACASGALTSAAARDPITTRWPCSIQSSPSITKARAIDRLCDTTLYLGSVAKLSDQGQRQASTTASANRRCRGSQEPAGSRPARAESSA